jgi:hypothetical protein
MSNLKIDIRLLRGIKILPPDSIFPEVIQLSYAPGGIAQFLYRECSLLKKKNYQEDDIIPEEGRDYDGIKVGSNPFTVILMNELFRKLGLKLRTSTPADLERALLEGEERLNLEGTFVNSGLVLRSEINPRDYLAKKLAEQVKARIGKKPKNAVMIPLCGLELVKDGSSDYGLAFKLREDAEIIDAPILDKSQGKFDSKDIDAKTGLPNKLGDGTRALYTRKKGLSQFDLLDGKNWYSDSIFSKIQYLANIGQIFVTKLTP